MTKRLSRLSSSFDYDYRPASYFQDLDPNTLILSSIVGEERRKEAQAMLASGGFDQAAVNQWLLDGKLDDDTREALGAIHPAFMGGEYLPSVGEDEIEVARIVFESTMQDVVSVRARRVGKRIVYRVVDEHDNTYTLAQKWSRKPLSLREMICFIDGSNEGTRGGSGLALTGLEMNLEYEDDPQSLRDFVMVDSDFYDDLSSYYALATDACVDRYVVEEEDDEDYEDDEEVGSPLAQSQPRQLHDLQNLPEDPAWRPMLMGYGIPKHLMPDGPISREQVNELIKKYGS